MTRLRFAILAALGLVVSACGADVETEPGASGSGGGGSGGNGSSQGNGGSEATSQGSGGSGGVACDDPWDAECNCAGCGGTCIQACNFDQAWDCYEPGAPAAGERSCGGFENCDASEACIHVTPQGDGCVDYFCTELPDDCADDPTCECLAAFTDEHFFETECTDDEGLEILFYGDAADPPWDRPACGLATCVDEESCWSCQVDGSDRDDPSTFQCAVGNPSIPGIQSCGEVWAAGE